jgi:hypothetical protein
MSATSPRVAPEQPADSQPAPLDRSKPLDSVHGVLGAGRMKPATAKGAKKIDFSRGNPAINLKSAHQSELEKFH